MKLYPKFNTMLLRCKAFNQNIGRQSKLTLSGHLMQVMWFLKQPKVSNLEKNRARDPNRKVIRSQNVPKKSISFLNAVRHLTDPPTDRALRGSSSVLQKISDKKSFRIE